MINSLQLERHTLAGLLRSPKIFYDVCNILSHNDFTNELHRTIFSILKEKIENGQPVDSVLVYEKIKNLGISFEEKINPFDYIEALREIKISEKGTVNSVLELKLHTTRREIYEIAQNLMNQMKNCSNMTYDQIISLADKIYYEKINTFEMSVDPENIFDTAEAVIEDLGNNPQTESGFQTPYAEFNRKYGGLRKGNVYAFAGRPGQGKTTILNDIVFKTCNIKNNIQCLVMDTEMSFLDIQKRMIASITGVPFWFIDTGNFRLDEEMLKKVRAAWPIVKKYNFHHLQTANKPIDEVMSIARRWYYSKVGRGNDAIISYDYLKLTGENVSDSMKEYQVIGDKVDKLKKLSEELNCPILTGIQMNRTAESQNRKQGSFSDDSSGIALSDRLQWFASFTSIFRRKTLDEISQDGEKYGTHKLIVTKTRFQGRDAAGHQDYAERYIDGEKKYVMNYLNFNVDNFNVEERGCCEDIGKEEKLKIDLDSSDNEDIMLK